MENQLAMTDKIKKIVQASIETKQQVLQNEELINRIEQVVEVVVKAFQNGKHVYFCGNGGSEIGRAHV